MSKLIVYHGGTSLLRSPHLKDSKLGKEYGQGFYLTESLSAASNWAAFHAKLNQKDKGIVTRYTLDTTNLVRHSLLPKDQSTEELIKWIALASFSLYNGTSMMRDNFAVSTFIMRHANIHLLSSDILEAPIIRGWLVKAFRAFYEHRIPLSVFHSLFRTYDLETEIVLKSDRAVFSLINDGFKEITVGSDFRLGTSRDIEISNYLDSIIQQSAYWPRHSNEKYISDFI